MSLLLDALKKAAEKKARKNAEAADGRDSTEKDQGSTHQPALQSGDEAALSAQTELGDSTQIDATEIEKPDIESTELDPSQYEQTEIDKTDLDLTDIDSTDIDKTDIDTTDVRSTAVNLNEIEATDLDATELEATEVDHSPTHSDLTDTELVTHTLTEEDKTLQFYEDDDDDLVRVATESVPDDQTQTQTQITDTRNIYRRQPGNQVEQLTEDDVTEFMGDGLTAEEVEQHEHAAQDKTNVGAEDTTITNRDALNLSNIDYEGLSLQEKEEEGFPMAQEDPRSARPSAHVYDDDARVPVDEAAAELELDEFTEHEKSTILNTDSTNSSIDIEGLTSDETVTIKDSTATRTFAPDNYDRTLLKLAQSDVSRIFPGMKAESDTVMTPDYAKKVFLNKSQGIKHSSYKVYAGIALLILMMVSMWGLFELQDESDMIDRSLIGLKRDPMPGIIRPQNTVESTILFPTESGRNNDKVLDIIATADQVEDSRPDAIENDQMEQKLAGDSEVGESPAPIQAADSPQAVQQVAEDSARAAAADDKQVASREVATRPTVATIANKGDAAAEKSAGLVITSSSRVSEKDQLLNAAYDAYESGDHTAAIRLYDQVLSLDPENRDALLGRAAIHVKDNESNKAIQFYQQLLETNPKDSVAMTSLISVINVDPVAGESQVKKLLREQPDAPYLHFALGNMYGSQQRWVEAQSAYFTALKYKPNDPNYAYNLAVSMEHMQKPNTAITFYQRALDNNSYGQATFDSQLVGQRIEVLSQ